ncbi:MAG: hypothetical protein ACNI25_09075 [Halarcobacter sp.]
MKSNMNDEPSLEKIDDFNDKESKSKRNTVKLVVVFCLVVGAIFAYVRSTNDYNDYVGTQEAPGITTTKK